ncbi:radical SAM protein [Clostridium weizhouense]|uniref:Radical SAM protein n=1 Tax=Clostridium weizhouense TaxID=2859781 RepID=A0ABS7AQX1_9CLOT|nr:radical SAM protein [Clostridium weizhouense]MBW6411077.1 radical SAM protein [Clostridium weizhouense]
MKYSYMLKQCVLCHRNCKVNRLNNELGFCNASDKVKIARAALHFWEEPPISGKNGSGTVFFSNCNFSCVFCQNHDISQEHKGIDISITRLADIFLELQEKGAHNINLVTPTHYVPQIIEALEISKSKGLVIPILYNTNSYDSLETIKSLNGYVDVYLPDFKYFNDKYSIKYSNAKEYASNALSIIDEMIKQVGKTKIDSNGNIIKGVIIRHLLLPGLLFDSKKIVDLLFNRYGDSVYISLMNQYTPMFNACNYPEINRPLNPKHYDSLIQYSLDIGLKNGFIQDDGTNNVGFIPSFNFEGVLNS